MRTFLGAVVGSMAWLSAQAVPPAPQPKAAPRPILIDTIVATVNDSAILYSALETNAVGVLRTEAARRGGLRPDEINRIYEDELDALIKRHMMALTAKTFGVASPEDVEAFLRRHLERDEERQIRDFGSHQAWSQALHNQGRTWQTFVTEQRVDKLAEYAEEFAVYMRLQQQSNLFLTPRMLRETYQREIGRFVRPAEAWIGLVVFRGPDAEANAKAATEAWRADDRLSSRGLATRYADTTATDTMLASSARKDLGDWALRGPLHNVSEPTSNGKGGFEVAKVLNYLPARNGRFEDPDVQEELRAMCRQGVIEEFKKQAFERARERTEVVITRSLR